MTYITNFLRFWYDFIIGDDWRIAVAVAATLVVQILLVHAHVTLWWLLLVVVILVLGLSVWQAARSS